MILSILVYVSHVCQAFSLYNAIDTRLILCIIDGSCTEGERYESDPGTGRTNGDLSSDGEVTGKGFGAKIGMKRQLCNFSTFKRAE